MDSRDLGQEAADRTLGDLAVSESEALFRSQFTFGNLGIAILSAERRWLHANPRLCELLGYSEDELQQNPWTELIHPDDRAADEDRFGRLLAGEIEPYELDERFLRKDGSVLFARLTASCPRGPDGAPRFVISSLVDISDRVAAEEALRQSQSMLNGVFRSAPIGIGVVSRRVLRWTNERLSEMTGHSSEEMAGQSARMLYPDQEEFDRVGREKYEQIRDHGTGVVETRWQCKDGHLIDVLLSSTPLEPGNLDAGVVFTALDITERKLAEAERQQALAMLEASIAQSPSGILVADAPDVTIRWANAAALGIRGGTDLPLTGIDFNRHASHWQTFRPDGAPYPPEELPLSRAVLKGEVVRDEEAIIRRASGEDRWVSVNAAPIRDRDGAVTAGIVVFHDITERRRAEAERLELERRLLHAQKLESLGILAGGIAHDFNNLLMAILGNLDVALLDLSPNSPARVRIGQAMQAVRRATDLTRQMLAYSGKGKFVVSHLDLSNLVRENADLFRTAIPKTVTIDLRLAAEPTAIEADAGQVQQVVMNLITNAAEAIADRAGVITLTTGIQECDAACLGHSRIEERPPAGPFVFLEVSDDGCGMDEDAQQRLFDPFFTTKFTGRGLGMSAVLGIVRGHGGAIFLDSADGRGTTIRVLFPWCETPAGVPPAPAGASPRAPGPAASTGAVLVVDDEEVVRGLCAAFVEHFGFTAILAADGEEALRLFEENADRIACVLLDLTMPRLDGVQTFQEMKRRRPDIPVILSSGYNQVDATRRFTCEGLAGFIQKPYRFQELKDLMDRVARHPSGPPS